MSDYYRQRNIKCYERTNRIIKELPPFCSDFFVGVENFTTPLTRLNYAYDLRVFFNYLNSFINKSNIKDITIDELKQLTASDIEYFLSYLTNYQINGKYEQCTTQGKSRKLATVRSFFKYLYNKDIIPSNVAAKVATPKKHEKEIIRLERNGRVDEVAGLIDIAENGNGLSSRERAFHDHTRLRDVAIITLFLGTGIRISELVGLNTDDFNFNNKSFIVTRKGGNRSVLYFNDEVAIALLNYLEERDNDKNTPKNETALFLSLKNRRISVRAIENLVKKYAKIVTPEKKITPHKLRSTFGTNLYRNTGDIYVVADCLGHNDINTTKKHYAAISEDIRKNAATSVTLRKDDSD